MTFWGHLSFYHNAFDCQNCKTFFLKHVYIHTHTLFHIQQPKRHHLHEKNSLEMAWSFFFNSLGILAYGLFQATENGYFSLDINMNIMIDS